MNFPKVTGIIWDIIKLILVIVFFIWVLGLAMYIGFLKMDTLMRLNEFLQ